MVRHSLGTFLLVGFGICGCCAPEISDPSWQALGSGGAAAHGG